MPTSAAVLDASVLVSGFLTAGPSRTLIDRAEQEAFRLVLSPVLIEETCRALLKPKLLAAYRHAPEAVDRYCRALSGLAQMVESDSAFLSSCRDPNDHHVIAAALAGGADYIVTGDADLLSMERYEAVRIVSARAFLELEEVDE